MQTDIQNESIQDNTDVLNVTPDSLSLPVGHRKPVPCLILFQVCQWEPEILIPILYNI